MPALSYTVSDFQPFTKILSASVNSRFSDIRTLLNTTKLDDDNLQDAGITRATKLKAGTANHALINGADGKMSSEAQLATSRGGTGFNPTISLANAGKAIIVNTAGNALELGSPSIDRLTQLLTGEVASLTVGEAIATNDAVCVDFDATNTYRIFKTDLSKANRKNSFLGFAVTAATATPQIQTFTFSADLVASNVVAYKINGRSYSTTYATNNDTTVTAIATQMGTDPDVQSAAVTGSTPFRVITITGKGALPISITGTGVTGGASQATITLNTSQSPVGQSVQVRTYGPMSGFTSLTIGSSYYLNASTPGGITTAPTDSGPVLVGQPLSTTVLWVPARTTVFPGLNNFYSSHGSTGGTTSASGVATVEKWNLSSWANDTSDATAGYGGSQGEAQFSVISKIIWGDYRDTATNYQQSQREFNKTSWAAATNKGAKRAFSAVAQLGNYFYSMDGYDGSGTQNGIYQYNGTSWSNPTNTGNAAYCAAGFTTGAKVHAAGGYNGGYVTANISYNGVSTTTETVTPANNIWSISGQTGGAAGSISGGGSGATTSYQWNGSAWGASIATAYAADGGVTDYAGANCGWIAGANQFFTNGGQSNATTSINSSMQFNGAAWLSSTASSVARSNATGGVL